jgi:recombination DNA repair RAD52 pathway protein
MNELIAFFTLSDPKIYNYFFLNKREGFIQTKEILISGWRAEALRLEIFGVV